MIAEKILYNGNIVTMADEPDRASALAIWQDRILAVGESSDMKVLAGTNTRLIDLKGRCLLPGFIESHNHASVFAMNTLRVDCGASSNSTIEDIQDKIRAKARTTPFGEWIQGFGYDDTSIADKRHLTRRDLDEAAPDHPVQVMHISVHFSYVNSRALEIAGIDSRTPQPEGGRIGLDKDGRPSGLMIEAGAMDLVRDRIPLYTPGQIRTALEEAFGYFHQAGITSIHDGGIGYFKHGPQVIEAYQELERKGRLRLRVYLTIVEDLYRGIFEKGFRSGFGSKFLRLGSVKMWQDGSIQGLTGALSQPYHTRPDICGDLLIPQPELEAVVEKYHSAGQQIAIHANGDRAIESVISCFEKVFEKCPAADRRHLIIHCQMASEDHLTRMKNVGLTPNFFVNHVYYWGDRHRDIFLGPERAARIDPLKTASRVGLDYGLHSDLPVTPVSPLFSVHTAVNRITSQGLVLGPEERADIHQALKAYTTTAARVGFEETEKGAIRPGLLADLVVLSDDPNSVPSDRIKDIEVLETWLGGDMVFQAD